LLELIWNDAGRKSVFLGKFGEGTRSENLYVSSKELCGTSLLGGINSAAPGL